MNMVKWFLVTCIAVVLTGCAAQSYSKNEAGITLAKSVATGTQALYDEANSHCKSVKKNAVLTMQDEETMTFECK
jgi:hypothetical protein